jgi:hypothetical protein
MRILQPQREARYMIRFGIGFVVAFYIVCVIARILLYVPRPGGNKEWGMASPHGDTVIMNLAATEGIVSCVQDVYILIIPIWLVSGLSIPLGRKIGILSLFLTGLL